MLNFGERIACPDDRMKNLPSGHKTDPKRDKKRCFGSKFIFLCPFFASDMKKIM